MNQRNPQPELTAATAARWIARRDAGLSEPERAEFGRWCAEDPRHAAAVEHFASAWAVLDRPQHGRASDAILRELGQRRRRRHRVAALAACALLVVGSGVFHRMGNTPPPPLAAVRAGGVLRAPEKRTLPDGSTVELKTGAEITVNFSPALRHIVLVQGEAHFQVTKDPGRPFAVEAGGMQVRAVGTAFSVHREERQVDVIVTEGRIAVERPQPVPVATSANAKAPSAPERIATAVAGERVFWQADISAAPAKAEVVAISPNEMVDRLAWREPRVEFSDTPLAEAVAMMNRSAIAGGAWQIVIDPSAAALAHEPISGLFRADNTETFVRMLELSLPVEARRRDRKIVLRARF